MRSVTLKQIGYRIKGTVVMNMWMGGEGEINMTPYDIIGVITKDRIINCINDGGFGCESIENADVYIYDLFEGNYVEINRPIFFKSEHLVNSQRGININQQGELNE